MKAKIFLTSMALCAIGTQAWAAPRWVRIAVPPSNAASSMVVSWNTDASPADNTVEYGTSPSSLTNKATGSSFAAKGKLGVVHEATATGLQANTTYHYRVGGSGDWSAVHTFKTGPDACTPFKFIAAGDHRSDDSAGPNPKWKSILGEMVATGAAFIVETGDLVRDGADLQQWWNHMEMGAIHMGEIALMPSFGNHDSDDVQGASAAFNQLFALPNNEATGTEDFYAFSYGNAVIVALSTATYDDAEGFAKQAKWLDETLAKHADKTWKFVFYHHPSYTSSIDLKIIDLNHPADEKKQNSHFLPIFDKHHVDIVFAGHNHFYERFAPMKGGAVVASPKDGTVYVTTGGAGAFTYDEIDVLGFKIEPMKVICGSGILGMSGKAKGSQTCSGKHHFMEISIDKNVLTAKVISTSEQNLSKGAQNVGVIDTFKIEKPAPAPGSCSTTPGGADAGSTDGGSADAGSADAGIADTGSADSVGVDSGKSDTAAADTAALDTASSTDTASTTDTASAGSDADAPGTDIDALDAPDEADEGTDVVAPKAETATGNGTGGGVTAPDTLGGEVSVAPKATKESGCTSAPVGGSGAWSLALVAAAWWRSRRRS